MYANDDDVELAIKLGYTHKRSLQSGSSFDKGCRCIWSTIRGWQTADIINGFYKNHKTFDNLGDALTREVK